MKLLGRIILVLIIAICTNGVFAADQMQNLNEKLEHLKKRVEKDPELINKIEKKALSLIRKGDTPNREAAVYATLAEIFGTHRPRQIGEVNRYCKKALRSWTDSITTQDAFNAPKVFPYMKWHKSLQCNVLKNSDNDATVKKIQLVAVPLIKGVAYIERTLSEETPEREYGRSTPVEIEPVKPNEKSEAVHKSKSKRAKNWSYQKWRKQHSLRVRRDWMIDSLSSLFRDLDLPQIKRLLQNILEDSVVVTEIFQAVKKERQKRKKSREKETDSSQGLDVEIK